MPIVWKDQMSVGNTTIDDEHKLLICLLNSIEIALKAENHGNMLRFLIGELHQYTRYHFIQEEKIMEAHNYKDYVAHKVEHQKILEQLTGVEEKLKEIPNESTDFSKIEEELTALMRSWIVDHVINCDLKMKSLFK